MIEVTSVKIHKVIEDPKTALVGIASIVICDGILIHNIRILKTPEKMFVAMPNQKFDEGVYKDIVHPINAENRRIIEDAVISAYTDYITNLSESDENAPTE